MKPVYFPLILLGCSYPVEPPTEPVNLTYDKLPPPVISVRDEVSMQREALRKCGNICPRIEIREPMLCTTSDHECTHGEGSSFCPEALFMDTHEKKYLYQSSGNIQNSMIHSYTAESVYENDWFEIVHDQIVDAMAGGEVNQYSYAPKTLHVRIRGSKFEVRENSELNGVCKF